MLDVSRTTAESWIELIVTKVNNWKTLPFVKASSVLDFVVILDTPLTNFKILIYYYIFLGAVYTSPTGISPNQWLLIDGGKHIGWDFFTHVT